MENYVVTGDAMEPEYYDGDMVQVEPARELEFGEIGIFLLGQEYIMREWGPGGLYAKNPNYPLLPAGGVHVVGRVKKVEK